jgi:hypothetical protein
MILPDCGTMKHEHLTGDQMFITVHPSPAFVLNRPSDHDGTRSKAFEHQTALPYIRDLYSSSIALRENDHLRMLVVSNSLFLPCSFSIVTITRSMCGSVPYSSPITILSSQGGRDLLLTANTSSYINPPPSLPQNTEYTNSPPSPPNSHPLPPLPKWLRLRRPKLLHTPPTLFLLDIPTPNFLPFLAQQLGIQPPRERIRRAIGPIVVERELEGDEDGSGVRESGVGFGPWFAQGRWEGAEEAVGCDRRRNRWYGSAPGHYYFVTIRSSRPTHV